MSDFTPNPNFVRLMVAMTVTQMLAKVSTEIHAEIFDRIGEYKATHIALFENLDMCSSQFGHRTVVPVGRNNTFKSPADCAGRWLGDLPSRRQYCVGIAAVSRDFFRGSAVIVNEGGDDSPAMLEDIDIIKGEYKVMEEHRAPRWVSRHAIRAPLEGEIAERFPR